MDEHLSEQEKVEKLRNWWKENGAFVIAGLVIGSLALFGWRSWNTHKIRTAEEASDLFQQLVTAVNLTDTERASGLLVTLKDDYEATPYPSQAALAVAGLHVGDEAYDKAGDELRYALDNLRGDKALGHIARLRLARVLLAADKADEAGALLDGKSDPSFEAAYEEVLGDIASVIGEEEQALSHYATALAADSLTPQQREIIGMKYQDLGGDPQAGVEP